MNFFLKRIGKAKPFAAGSTGSRTSSIPSFPMGLTKGLQIGALILQGFWRRRASSKSTIIFGNSANKYKRKIPQKV
jgi:hypothetical protein